MTIKYHGQDGYGPPVEFTPIPPYTDEQIQAFLNKQVVVQDGRFLVHEEAKKIVAECTDSKHK